MKYENTLSSGLVICIVSAICLAGGCQQYESPKPPETVKELNRVVEQVSVQRKQMIKDYKEMSVSGLVQKLEIDSAKNIEPFNSLVYKELVSRGSRIGASLKTSLKTADRDSFLTLLALRKVNMSVYRTISPKTRLDILIDTLRSSKYFNTWGLPHLYWEDAAKAIIAEGTIAIEPLKSLLQNKRMAPVWGSEETLEYKKYKYRVCDYALAMIKEIKKEKVEIPENPAARDRMISGEL